MLYLEDLKSISMLHGLRNNMKIVHRLFTLHAFVASNHIRRKCQELLQQFFDSAGQMEFPPQLFKNICFGLKTSPMPCNQITQTFNQNRNSFQFLSTH